MTTLCFCQPDIPQDSHTGHKRGPHALIGPALLPSRGGRRRPCPSGGDPQGKPCTFPSGVRWLFSTSCHRRMRRPQGCGHGGLGVCFLASCTGISGAAERSAFFFLISCSILINLKEIKLRCPPLTNSDLQVGGQGECHPGCCPVAMEPLTAMGLRLGLGRCAEQRPAALPTRLPATERHRARTLQLCF